MTEDRTGQPTDDEIDALLRESLGEIDSSRFDEFLNAAIATGRASMTDRSSTSTGLARVRARPARWLAVAAAVAAVALGAAILSEVGGQGSPPEVADDPATSVPATSVPATSGPVAGPPSVCRPTEPGTFRCDIRVLVPGSEPATGATVLVYNGVLRDELDDSRNGGERCIEARSTSGDLQLVPGQCDGTGLRAAALAAGTYRVEYRLRTCGDAASCGPPETGWVGTIIVEAT